MNAMTNFTVKSLRANRVRTLVTIIGVALAAALLTAVMSTYTSLNDFLYRTEAATGGTWMAYAESEDNKTLEEGLIAAQNDPDVIDMAVVRDVGFGELTYKQQQRFGQYQTILSYDRVTDDGNAETILGIEASEGRLPEHENEILLFQGWETSEGIEVGDTISFQVGNRVAVESTEETRDQTNGAGSRRISADGSDEIESFGAGSVLSSSTGYLDAALDGSNLDERLVDKQEKSYTVVGFYDRINSSLYSGVGPVALTTKAPVTTDYAEAFLVLANMHTSEEVQQHAQSLFPQGNIQLHTSLLRFMGISSDTSIWTTFYGLIAILSTVIILACVSLIFNAFAISVAERASQFGLLSSVGATRRQLRRAVLWEAFFVALIGIPLGLLIGIGGCAITFAILGPAIAQIAGNGIVAFELALDPLFVGAVILLTLVTVFVSVWIPAKRASSTNIIDSLKNSSASRITKRGEKAAAHATNPKKLWRAGGFVSRVFGMGGKLATINRKRGSSKGRTASVSLALAVVLLMTSGSLNVFLGSLIDAVTDGHGSIGEVNVTFQLEPGEIESEEPIDAQKMLQMKNKQFSDELEVFVGAYEYLGAAPNCSSDGWTLNSGLPVIFPKQVAGSAFDNADTVMMAGPLENGDYAANVSFYFIDDDLFNEYAQGLGLDPQKFYDVAQPRAVGVSQTYGNDGSAYKILNALREPGSVSVITGATYLQRYPAIVGLAEVSNHDGKKTFELMPSVLSVDDAVSERDYTMNDIETVEVDLEIAALAQEPPEIIGSVGSTIQFILPVSMAQHQAFGLSNPVFKAAFSSTDGDHAQLAEELSQRGSEFLDNMSPYESTFRSYNDLSEEKDTVEMMATIVNVFCLLFTIILALIAMANVFNTVTNSLILRRREFAVMKSIGLSNRQFRRMIMDECMRFGIAGLIPGMIVSVGVSYLLYAAIGQSVDGLIFSLPWSYVALALGMTIAAMGISVAYGMHRCKTDNVVEALRADSI